MASRPNRVPLFVRLQRVPGRLLKWLADLGAAAVSPFERAFGAVFQRMFKLSEGFEGVEAFFLRLGWVLLWPVRMLWRILAGLAGVLLPQSARNVLAAPYHGLARLGQALGSGFMRAAEALNLDGVVLRLVQWTRPIWYPCAALGGFFQAWVATRSYKRLLWGLPVVLILLPLVSIAVWMMVWGKQSAALQYRLAVAKAREEKDFQRVQLFERKLAQLGVNTQLTDYQTATALAQDGKYDEAYERMKLLAPIDRTGYPPAHYWIIQQLLTGTLKLPPDEAHRLIGVHLDHIQGLGLKGPEVDLLRAYWLTQSNQLLEAAKLLEPIANRLLPAAIMRMEIDLSLKQLDEARRDARLVRSHMEDLDRNGHTFSAQDYRSWAVAEELLGDLPKAHSLIERWLKLEPGNKLARRILADLSRRLFDANLAAPDPDADRLATLFIQAAEFTDDPRQLQQQVAALYRLRAHFPVAQRVVDRVVSSPRTPASILEAAGTVAAAVGEFDKAKQYLQLAVKKDPRNSIAWNNYAWLIAQEPDGDLADALAAVTKALEILPEEFRYRETRGQILVRLGKWQEAVEDLEFAANGMPESREIHLSLAKAYDALGETQLARVHRQHAQ